MTAAETLRSIAESMSALAMHGHGLTAADLGTLSLSLAAVAAEISNGPPTPARDSRPHLYVAATRETPVPVSFRQPVARWAQDIPARPAVDGGAVSN